jgi:hypothetical protein
MSRPAPRPHHELFATVQTHEKPGAGYFAQPDHALSDVEVEQALSWTRQLDHRLASWYRCQELTVVARGVADRRQRDALLREALASANGQTEPNRIVTVAAWPLRALLDAGEAEWFVSELERLLRVIQAEPNPFRRQDGLYALLFIDAPTPCFERVLERYCEACAGAQKTLTMRRAAAYVSRVNPEQARCIAELIHDPRRRRQALRAVGNETEDRRDLC